MPNQTSAKRYLILAIAWSLAAGAMAVGILLALPGIAPMPALVFGLCAVCAVCWWGSYLRARRTEKAEQTKKTGQN